MGLTKKKTTKPKCLLLDANIIIESYKLGIWERLVERLTIAIPSVIIQNEARFFAQKNTGVLAPINLSELINQGKIIELAADSSDLIALAQVFDQVFIQGIHPGEYEALSLLYAGKAEECFLCTGDKTTIWALALLGMSDRGVSLERVLSESGLQCKLSYWFEDHFFQKNINIGQQKRIQGDGLIPEKKKRKQ